MPRVTQMTHRGNCSPTPPAAVVPSTGSPPEVSPLSLMLQEESCAFASLSAPPQAWFPVIQVTGNPLPSPYRIPGSTPGGVSGAS